MASDDLLIERLLRVIDEGRRTATYKLALLLGLIDSIGMQPGQSELRTRSLATRVLELYYPQTRTYVDASGARHQPRQISMKSSTVIAAVERLRVTGDQLKCRTLGDIASQVPHEYAATLDVIEDTFVRYPIPLLQTVGTTVIPFLYEVDWSEGTSVVKLRSQNADRIRLLDGVADRLIVLGPMLRPLIEHHWVQDVARWTKLRTEADLHAHLFGRGRIPFPRTLVTAMRDMQHDRCFYCGDPLGGSVQVDHFVPWSRWPNDAIENLVLADRCNNAKSDHLAGTPHLQRWRERLDSASTELSDIAATCGWLSSIDRSRALAQSSYMYLPTGTPLWIRGKQFELVAGPAWT